MEPPASLGETPVGDDEAQMTGFQSGQGREQSTLKPATQECDTLRLRGIIRNGRLQARACNTEPWRSGHPKNCCAAYLRIL